MQLIQQVEIPEYIVKIQMSKKRRRKYYRKKKNGVWKPRDLPPTYKEKIENGVWRMDNNDKYVLDENGDKVLANPQSAGKPRYRKLSGNDFASGYGSPHIRAKLVRKLKEFYRPFVLDMHTINKFPIQIKWELHTTIPDRLFDPTNFWFYYKYFEDCLFEYLIVDIDDNVKFFSNSEEEALERMSELDSNQHTLVNPVMPDDNIMYVTKPGTAPEVFPIENWKDRKFVFKFYHDQREIIQNNQKYKDFHNDALWS